MKRLLQKLGLFFFVLLLIKMPFTAYFEDNSIYRKFGFINMVDRDELAYRRAEFAKQDFDTVFIGSSRTVGSVIPAYFDALTDNTTKSYNFGVISGLPPQTFDWCEDLIQTKPSLKNVFFELSGGYVEPLTRRQLQYALSVYLTDQRSLTFAKSANYHNNLFAALLRPDLPARYDNNYYNILLPEALAEVDKPVNGFFSLPEVRLAYLRNAQFKKENSPEFSAFDEIYWSRVARLVELAEAKQIRIYFFIPPRLERDWELETVYPIYQKLDARNKLNVAHYDETLYQIDTSNDNYHLNHKGALHFTKLMAETFKNHGF